MVRTKKIGIAIRVPIVPGAMGESPEPKPNDESNQDSKN